MTIIRISYAMNVLNGEPFIRHQLESIYRHADEIIIVEGAYKKFKHAATNYHSMDNTLQLIREFPDKDSKIKVISNDCYYDDRLEMCNEFMKIASGDIIWQVDCDEFYDESTHQLVRKLMASDSDLDEIRFKFKDYYKNLNLTINGYYDIFSEVRRVFRIKRGDLWASQRPPIIWRDNKIYVPKKIITGCEMKEKGHIMHNATMLFDKQVCDKFKYYSAMWRKSNPNFRRWYNESWISAQRNFSITGINERFTYLRWSSTIPPKELMDMMQFLKGKGGQSSFLMHHADELNQRVKSLGYIRTVVMIRMINDLYAYQLIEGACIAFRLIFRIAESKLGIEKRHVAFVLFRNVLKLVRFHLGRAFYYAYSRNRVCS